ncbi:MAG: hypothetical protein ACRBBP_11635 [Bdellovibrionales bacterium]
MSNPTINFIQHLILSIKSGRSTLQAKNSWDDPFILAILNRETDLTNIEYELKILIEKGLAGFPILKLLEGLHLKAKTQLVFEMEKHSKKTPFLALIPLFLLQVPSLILIFLYPMISNFIKELS